MKKLTNGKWVFTYFMQLLLPQLVCLSKTLQDNESTIETMRVKLDAILLKLSNYDIKKKLTDFSDENFKDMSYCNHQLTSGATRRIPGESNLSGVIDKTASELDNLVKGTSECIKARFDSFSSNDVLRAFQVTEPRGWPTRKEELFC